MAWNWELHRDETEEIPKDLLAFFVGLMPEKEKSSDVSIQPERGQPERKIFNN